MVVLVEYVVGELGRVRGGPGRREGECRPGCEPAAVSETSAKEGCGRRRSGGPLHAYPHHALKDQLEAGAESRTGEEVPRGGGDYATHTEDLQVDERGLGVPSSGPGAADAHAGERCGKRIRTATSEYDADTPT